MTDQTIYVIRHPDDSGISDPLLGYYKIGVTNDLGLRLSRLQGGTPYELEVMTTIEPVGDATDVEAALHDLFAIMRRRGEWFALTPPQVEDLCELESVSADVLVALRKRVAREGLYLSELSLLREVRAQSTEVKAKL